MPLTLTVEGLPKSAAVVPGITTCGLCGNPVSPGVTIGVDEIALDSELDEKLVNDKLEDRETLFEESEDDMPELFIAELADIGEMDSD